jgi:hypothetical protein
MKSYQILAYINPEKLNRKYYTGMLNLLQEKTLRSSLPYVAVVIDYFPFSKAFGGASRHPTN